MPTLSPISGMQPAQDMTRIIVLRGHKNGVDFTTPEVIESVIKIYALVIIDLLAYDI
jgi:hypothetical protein